MEQNDGILASLGGIKGMENLHDSCLNVFSRLLGYSTCIFNFIKNEINRYITESPSEDISTPLSLK